MKPGTATVKPGVSRETLEALDEMCASILFNAKRLLCEGGDEMENNEILRDGLRRRGWPADLIEKYLVGEAEWPNAEHLFSDDNPAPSFKEDDK